MLGHVSQARSLAKCAAIGVYQLLREDRIPLYGYRVVCSDLGSTARDHHRTPAFSHPR